MDASGVMASLLLDGGWAAPVERQLATAEELIAWCRSHLAAYKCPRYVVFADIPKTSTGKLQKFKLREVAKEM
jgi:acyl-CoA synthetase (AMP-forming)/AMP-acid ligase II